MNLFEKISKKYLKLQKLVEQNKLEKQNGVQNNANKVDGDTSQNDVLQDFPLYEEVLRTILEIMNACLTKNLSDNPNLIYTLLYNRKVFDPFLTNSSFQDIIFNIETGLNYFSTQIENTEGNRSVEEVFEIIKHASLKWSNDKLKVNILPNP